MLLNTQRQQMHWRLPLVAWPISGLLQRNQRRRRSQPPDLLGPSEAPRVDPPLDQAAGHLAAPPAAAHPEALLRRRSRTSPRRMALKPNPRLLPMLPHPPTKRR